MATDIYAMIGQGHRGSRPMAHLVSIGAHDGHGAMGKYQLRKVKPNTLSQYRSWFDPASPWGYEGGNPLVGQIFFPTSGASLDTMTDRVVLDALLAWYRFDLSQQSQVVLEFVGNADARGAASYNQVLGLRRAESTQHYVDARIRLGTGAPGQLYRYRSSASSLGETNSTGDNAADRRVDIVLRSVKSRSNQIMDPITFTGENTGPLTKKLLFRGWGGGSAGDLVNIDFLELEIKNGNTGVSAFYTYTGGSLGVSLIPISVAIPVTDYEAKDVPIGFVDVEDFEGFGSISGATAVGTVQCLIFSGPELVQSMKVLKKRGIEFCFSGQAKMWELPSASLGAGYWNRQPYRSEAEREVYLANQAEARKKREWRGPKY